MRKRLVPGLKWSALLVFVLLTGFAFAEEEIQPPTGPQLVGEPVVPTITRAVRDLPDFVPDPNLFGLEAKRRETFGIIPIEYPIEPRVDPLMKLQELGGPKLPDSFATLVHNYAGQSSSVSPPDTNGDVGLAYFLQGTNQSVSSIQVLNKATGAVVKTFTLEEMASSSPCNSGFCDVVVNYDRAADRWLLTELPASGGDVCVYVSTSGDPTGTYYAYAFAVESSTTDYPKYGVWPQNGTGGSYVMGANAGSSGKDLFAFDRAKMLAGQAATFQKFTVASLPNFSFQLVLPAGRDSISLLPQPNGILQVVTVPVAVDRPNHQIFGTLGVGFLLDDALLAELKRITGSDLAFGMDGQILASTLPRARYPALAEHLRQQGISRVELDAEEYTTLSRSLSSDAGAAGAPAANGAAAPPAKDTSPGPVALILRSRTAQLESLRAIHTGFAVTGVLAMVLAMALSFTVARTIARPLAAITDVMREVAATGDLTRNIALRYRNRWDDEDARLLASTFNTLTDSIARFQREMTQKERLTSLGRLSTIIAHEVRNPLMIIKAALHTLRQPGLSAEALREAAEDIDGEVARLNGIVNDVLDFARPITFTLAPVEINAVCRESAAAAVASGPGSEIGLDLDPALSTLTTDPERLRIALVNMLVNARHAVNGTTVAPGAPVTLTTRVDGERVRIVVADRGVGIAADDLAHVFDPYFTTKRGGTGLGLPIAKNIVEGLGGTIAVSSTPGLGTEFLIDLPAQPPQARPRS